MNHDVNYTPTETDRKTALKVLGWSYRECMNELCPEVYLGHRYGETWVSERGEHLRKAYDDVIADIQHQWKRYTERVGRG